MDTTKAKNLGGHRVELFVIALEGEFDLSERSRLIEACTFAAFAPTVVVALEKTTYLDSSLLECLVLLRRQTARRDARLILVGLRPDIRRVFDRCSLEQFFEIRAQLSDVVGVDGIDPARMRRLALVAERTVPLGG